VSERKDEARALFESVLADHPNDFDALLHRGKLEVTTRHYTEAERWIRKALKRKPHDADARYALYQSLRGQANRQDEAHKELARWKQERWTRDRLIRLVRTELDLRPHDPKLATETGELFLQRGEDRHGLFWLHRALSFDPRHAPAHKALIAYYDRIGNKARAAEHRRQLAAIELGK
jgi:Flp pilus assembly protein TadD